MRVGVEGKEEAAIPYSKNLLTNIVFKRNINIHVAVIVLISINQCVINRV